MFILAYLQWCIIFNSAIYSKLKLAVSEDEANIISGLISEMEVQLRYCKHHLGDAAATSSLLAMTDASALGDKLDVMSINYVKSTNRLYF